MLSELHNLNFKICTKQYNKIDVLHLIEVPQLGGGWQHNFSTKTRHAGRAIEHLMYSLMSMNNTHHNDMQDNVMSHFHCYTNSTI
jgi:hypothetical protein